MIESNKEAMYLQIKEGLYGDELKQYNEVYFKFFDVTDIHSRLDKRKEEEWQEYLSELNILSDKNSLLALKIIIALLYRRNVLYHNEIMFEFLKHKQDMYFLNPSTGRNERLIYGIELATAWPDDVGSQFNKYFTTSIELLFIEEAKENPVHALELFDKIVNYKNSKYRNYFFSFLNNSPINFLSFAREVETYRPLLFANALVNFVEYYNNEYYMLRDIMLDSTKLLVVSTELYGMINKNTYPKGFNLERALQIMIRYCPMNAVWYENLFDKFWEIECDKSERDEASLDNYFLITLNSTNEELIEDVEKYYFVWRDKYRSFDVKDTDMFINHISELDKVSRKIFNNHFADYRNIHVDIDIQKNIIDNFLMLYWDILAWLKEKNTKLYFMILVSYLRIDYNIEKPMTQRWEIAQKAKNILIDEFESFANENTESASVVVGILLQNSRRHETTHINQVLNKVFFILKDIDEVTADIELFKVLKKEEEHYKHYDRGGPNPWRPSYAASSTYATSNLLKTMSKSYDEEIRKNVAQNPNTPVDILDIMSKDTSEEVRAKVALNPSTVLETLNQLVNSGEKRIVSFVCRNPNIDADFLYEMCKQGSQDVRWNIAMNPNIPQKCIELLSNDKDTTVRASIAEHSKTGSDTLKIMSKDIEYRVRQEVAKNPNTPSEVLDELSRSYVNNFSQDALNTRSKNIRKKFKSFYRTLKYKMTGNYAKYMFEGLFIHSTDIIHEYRTIRSSVALNPNVSLETLERLLDDEDNYVVSMVESTLKTRKEENVNEV